MPRAKNKPIPQMTGPDVERFWAKVDRTIGHGPTGECWPFAGSHTSQGYGRFYIRKGLEIRANRMAYFLASGEDPGPLEVLHSCDWEPCCRPGHLHTGTRLDNAREAISRGLYPTGDRNGARKHPESLARGDNHWARRFGVKTKGESNGFSIFKEDQIKEIRRLYAAGGVSLSQLAVRFHSKKPTIHGIVSRRSWKHI